MKRFWQSVVKPPYPGLPWLVWFYVLFCFFVMRKNGVWAGNITGFDDNVRMVQVLNWINNSQGWGAGWYDRTIARANPPEGFTTIWSRIVDMPIAAVIVVAQQFVAQKTAALIAVTFVPFAEIAILFRTAAYFARPLLGKKHRRLILLFIISTSILNRSYFAISGFFIGEASHRSWYIILDLLMFGAVGRLAVGSLRRSTVLTLALSIALLTAVGIESYPMIAGAAAILACIAWLDNRPAVARQASLGLLLGALGALVLVPIHQPPAQFFVTSYAEPSILGFYLILAAALFLKIEQHILRICKSRTAAFAGLAIAATVIGGGLVVLFPQLLDGGAAGLSPQERRIAFTQHLDGMPLYKVMFSTLDFFGFFMPMLLGLQAAIFAVRASRGRRRSLHLAYLGFALISCGLSMQFSRYYNHAMTTGAAWLTWLWQRIKENLPGNRFYYPAAVLTFILLGPLWTLVCTSFNNAYKFPLYAHLLFFPSYVDSIPDRCDPNAISEYIDSHYPPDTLLNVRFTESATLLYHSHVRIDFLANYPSQNKFIDSFALFDTKDPEVARVIALRHGIDLLLVCKWPQTYKPDLPDRAQSLFDLTKVNHVPAWLKWVDTKTDSGFMLYEIDKNAVRQNAQ